MPAIRRGEVWWVSFDRSVGGEIRKTRPAVVFSNDAANAALNRVVVIPVTSQTAKVYPGEALIAVEKRPAKAMTDQAATTSKQRLRGRIGALSDKDMRAIEEALLLHLGIHR